MAVFTLNVNNKTYNVEVEPDMPLLWVLRDKLNLTGAKFGCGMTLCGACTVLLNGDPIRSCQVAVAYVMGSKITTIEGLSPDGNHPLQQAWIEEDVPQCGYCQAGQIMVAAALLRRNPNPTEADIDNALQGNLCRCGTYVRIRKAVLKAAAMMKH